MRRVSLVKRHCEPVRAEVPTGPPCRPADVGSTAIDRVGASPVTLSRLAIGPAGSVAPMGLAIAIDPQSGDGCIYVCDPERHCILILDGRGRPIAVFGRKGTRPGEFDTPVDLALVLAPGSGIVRGGLEHVALIAVADRGNDRVQLFEPDGVPFGVIGSVSRRQRRADRATGVSFRAGVHERLTSPWCVSAIGTTLHVNCADRVVTLDIAAALVSSDLGWRDEPLDAPNRRRAHGRQGSTWLM